MGAMEFSVTSALEHISIIAIVLVAILLGWKATKAYQPLRYVIGGVAFIGILHFAELVTADNLPGADVTEHVLTFIGIASIGFGLYNMKARG